MQYKIKSDFPEGVSVQQKVCAMVGRSVSYKFYLHSTFGHVGQIRFQTPTTAQTQTCVS